MFTFKHVVIFFVLQNIFVKDRCNGQNYSGSIKFITSVKSKNEVKVAEIDYVNESPEINLLHIWDDYHEDLETNSSESLENDLSQNPDVYKEDAETNSLKSSGNNSNDNPGKPEKPDINNNDIPENDNNGNPKKTDFCPDDQSIISHSDINYLIEENAEVLKIKQHFVNISYPDAEELIKKYEGELGNFLGRFIERPDHLQHILYDMADLRQKLEPNVEKIVSQLEQFYTLEKEMNIVTELSDNKLRQLERYKNLCQMNCDEIDIRNRFGQNSHKNPLQSLDKYCIRIEDLNNIINEKLRDVQAQNNDSFYVQLEINEKMYAQKISEFQTNLEKSAVKLFGRTMYNILNLQDDYHHFVNHLKQVNVSSEIHIIRKNTAEIGLRLIGLETDIEKYRQYCLKCFVNQRLKRNTFGLLDTSTLNDEQERAGIPIDDIAEVETVVTELIKVIIDEIRESIKSNLTSMFEELDIKLNNTEVIDEYVTQLHPKQDVIEKFVQSEQDDLIKLKNRVPIADVDRILELSKKSNQAMQDLETAKQFIAEQFIS